MAFFQWFPKSDFAQEDFDTASRLGLESSEGLAFAFTNLGEADALGVGAAWQLARRDAKAFAYAAGKQLSAAVSSLSHAAAAVSSVGGGAAVSSPGGVGSLPTVAAAVSSAAEGAARSTPRSQKTYKGPKRGSAEGTGPQQRTCGGSPGMAGRGRLGAAR